MTGTIDHPSNALRPKRLHKGDVVGVFSPSEPITDRRLGRLNEGLSLLRSNGFQTSLAANALKAVYYMAGSVRQRADDISELIENSRINALITSWGGKSCNQLLPHLNYSAIANARKPLLGFSDGCVLANAITGRTSLVTFYGPNVVGKLSETHHANLALLFGDENFHDINLLGNVNAVEAKVIKSGSAEGRLFGGNLSTFVLGLVGSDYIPFNAGGLFFWESGGETPQIVHQLLSCIRNAGLFDKLGGMIIGDFIRPEPDDYKRRDPLEMILEVTSGFTFPIVYCPTFGHLPNLENPIIPIGLMARMDSSTMTLKPLESVVD
jgi:muramoyltetrapeptide carboxypeptidase